MQLLFRLADTRGDVRRCRQLIAGVYQRDYGVAFSESHFDLEAKIECWPHRYLMTIANGDLVATCGLYTHDTYVERFGGVAEDDLRPLIEQAGAGARHTASNRREFTKMSVRHDWRGRGISRWLTGAGHSRHFTHVDVDRAVMVFCAKISIINSVFHRAGLRTRRIKPFPFYKVHERYRSAADPMESRLIIPEMDIPEPWYNLALPCVYDIDTCLQWNSSRDAAYTQRLARFDPIEGREIVGEDIAKQTVVDVLAVRTVRHHQHPLPSRSNPTT